MLIKLNNEFFQFAITLDPLTWGIQAVGLQGVNFRQVPMKVTFAQDGKPREQRLESLKYQAQPMRTMASPIGRLEVLEVSTPVKESPLRYRLSFALVESTPLFLWKVAIENTSGQPLSIRRITLLDMQSVDMPFARAPEPAFYSNGWGSWDYSGVYTPQDTFHRSHLGFIDTPMRVNAGSLAPRQRGHFAADMFGVVGDRASRSGVLLGFLSQEQHFGSLEVDFRPDAKKLRMWANGDDTLLAPGAEMHTDWACIQPVELDAAEPLAPYLDAAARLAGIEQERFQGEIPAGWCSWYHFYNRLSAEDIRSNLQALVKARHNLPLQVVQIDDGFETHVGDWLDIKPGFPAGLVPLAKEIHQAGFTPGLWLAPFILDRRSRLAREHPEWLLRGRFNLPVNASFLWNGFTTALDISFPPALEYACGVVRKAVHEWGFSYLKFDFLYAGALPGRRADRTRTRAQILRAGLQALREAAGDQVFLLGCGCPMGTGLGLVDGMRIGADVDARWTPVMLGKDIPFLRGETGHPSARNAIQNTLTRACLHRRWWLNDPDCLLLRQVSSLTQAETHSLATVIALSGGMLLLSDHLPDLPPERLEIARRLLPIIGKRPQVLDWFDAAMPRRLRLDLDNGQDNWSLLAVFNWQDEAQETSLCLQDFAVDRPGEYWLRDFWRGEVFFLTAGEQHRHTLPAHGTGLYALRRMSFGEPAYLGSDLHISQGQEVKSMTWQPEHGVLKLALSRPGEAAGNADIYLPRLPLVATLDGRQVSWIDLGHGVYRFPLVFSDQACLRIQCREVDN